MLMRLYRNFRSFCLFTGGEILASWWLKVAVFGISDASKEEWETKRFTIRVTASSQCTTVPVLHSSIHLVNATADTIATMFFQLVSQLLRQTFSVVGYRLFRFLMRWIAGIRKIFEELIVNVIIMLIQLLFHRLVLYLKYQLTTLMTNWIVWLIFFLGLYVLYYCYRTDSAHWSSHFNCDLGSNSLRRLNLIGYLFNKARFIN